MALAGWRERPVPLLVAGVVVPLAAIAVALVSQHVYDIQPCPWCVLQRLIFALIAVACLAGLAFRGVRRAAGGAVLLLAVGGTVAALWQHFVAAASASCNLTLADKLMNATTLNALLPEVFEARASCADAAVNLAGIPYEFYSLALFLLLGFGGALLLTQRAR
jgi:disulfide bond formation protein DsbB